MSGCPYCDGPRLVLEREFVLLLPDGRHLLVENRQPEPGECAWRVEGYTDDDVTFINYILDSEGGEPRWGWRANSLDARSGIKTVVLREVQP